MPQKPYILSSIHTCNCSLQNVLFPELIESAVYLYQATKDPYFLEVGRDIIEAIDSLAWTPCGYATVSDISYMQLTHYQIDYSIGSTVQNVNFCRSVRRTLGGRGDTSPEEKCL